MAQYKIIAEQTFRYEIEIEADSERDAESEAIDDIEYGNVVPVRTDVEAHLIRIKLIE